MVGVLGPVGVDHFVGSVIPLQREVHLQHVGAGLDDLQDAMGLLDLVLAGAANVLHVLIDQHVLGKDASLVEEVLNHLKEAGVLKISN